MQDCGGVIYVEPGPTPTSDPGLPAAYMATLLLVALLVFELWALLTHHNTISHMTQRVARHWPWMKALLAIGVALLGVHLIWGF